MTSVDVEAVAHHRRNCGSGTSLSSSPGRNIVQRFSENIVVGESDIGQSQSSRQSTAIHFIVLPVPAVHFDDGGFVTIGIGIHGRATECLCPISG